MTEHGSDADDEFFDVVDGRFLFDLEPGDDGES